MNMIGAFLGGWEIVLILALLLILFGLLGQVEQGSEFETTGDECIAGGRIHPKNALIFLTVTIGVLDSHLGFADAT